MNLARTYNNWRSYRNTLAELNGMSNRNLADIGIVRGNIGETARKAAQ